MGYLIKNAIGIYAPGYPGATDLRIKGNRISTIGQDLVPEADDILIDARECVVWPGLVSTHHHLAQSIMKGVPEGLNQSLGDWLRSVPWKFWPHFTPEMMYHAARLGLYEMLRSGVTTCADHHYLYHRHVSTELEESVWRAASDLGIRFALCRGFAIEAGSHKGMLESGVVPETVDLVLKRLDHSRRCYHDSSPEAMRRLVVAPTSLVHSSGPESLVMLSDFSRQNGLKRHSHLLEVSFDDEQARHKYGMSAIDYAEYTGWLGEDVWFAHLVHSGPHAINRLAETGTGIGHCPTSNCRLGSGIAPLRAMADAGVRISLGVDGSASSESASMLQELNMCWLIHRAIGGPDATTTEEVLSWGTEGGASILGWNDVGKLAEGMIADIVLFDLHALRYGGVHSPLIAPLICGEPASVKYSFINGRPVVSNNEVLGLDQNRLLHDVRESVTTLLRSL